MRLSGTVGRAGCPLVTPSWPPGQLWDGPGLTPHRCCRQGACPGAVAPYGFAEALSKCVQVHIWPNNVSVTSPGVQVRSVAGTWQGRGAHVLQWTLLQALGFPQLTVAMSNVPDLSAGVSCAFEEVTQSEAVLLPSGELRCPSPSLQELRALTRGHGQWMGLRGVGDAVCPWLTQGATGSLQGPPALCGCSCSPRRPV